MTGILAALLYLLVAVALDAAGYVESMALLVPVTLGALALGFLMAFSRFDGFFALSHSLFTGLAWILFLMTRLAPEEKIQPFVANGIPPLQAKAYFVLLQWLNWVDAMMGSTANADNYVFIFEISFLVWWLTFLGVWAIFRHGYTWRAVIPAGIVLVINTYYAPRSIMGFLIVFALLALVFLVRTNLAEQQLRWREERIYFSPDITLDFMRNALLYSVMVLAIAWIVPGLGRSMQVQALMDPINDRWLQTSERMNELYKGLNRQTRPTIATFGRSLDLGGARNVGDGPVFEVSAPQGRYWRAVVFDTFTGTRWLNTVENEQDFAAAEPAPVAAWFLRQPVTQTVTLLAASGGVIFGAPDIRVANVPVTALVQPVPAAALATTAEGEPEQALEYSLVRSSWAQNAGDSYQVISNYTAVTERALREAGTDYPPEITERYLQLPENFSQRVAETARSVVEGRPTVYDQTRALETYLRGFTYNEQISAPPPGRDPVEYFLYDIKEGYCDYYATAMAVMLRSLGIPARTASGYAEGSYDPERRMFTLTERDAHTWVEVYFPALGWVEFEPTAGESQLNRPPGDDPTSTALGSEPTPPPQAQAGGPNQQNPNQLQNEQPFAEDQPFYSPQEIAEHWPLWLGALLTLAALVVGGYVIWRTQVRGPVAFSPDLPPLLYERMQRWGERLGAGQGHERTPYESAVRLGQALPEGESFIKTITDVYVFYRFSGRGAEVKGAAQAGDEIIAAWQQLHPLFWKAWLRKVTGPRRAQGAGLP